MHARFAASSRAPPRKIQPIALRGSLERDQEPDGRREQRVGAAAGRRGSSASSSGTGGDAALLGDKLQHDRGDDERGRGGDERPRDDPRPRRLSYAYHSVLKSGAAPFRERYERGRSQTDTCAGCTVSVDHGLEVGAEARRARPAGAAALRTPRACAARRSGGGRSGGRRAAARACAAAGRARRRRASRRRSRGSSRRRTRRRRLALRARARRTRRRG